MTSGISGTHTGDWPPSIRIKTQIPGPNSLALSSAAASSVARPVRPAPSVFIERGRGALVEDIDGNVFVDMTAGLGCLIVGHSHPKVTEAINDQVRRFLHTDFTMLAYESYVELSGKLSQRCGGGRHVALFNSGAEAVENAVKIARYVTGRPGILCFEGAFHGRTHMALSLTGREEPYKRGFGPFSPDVHRLPYPGLNGTTLSDFEAATGTFESHEIAAAIVEPVLGEGGFVVPPREFLPALEALCRRHGALLVLDEIQSGYGRTGAFLASTHWGVDADVILLGKSIAAGLPLSALVARSEITEELPPGSLGGTYVGNPVACVAALAVLDVIETENLMERAGEVGLKLLSFWRAAARSHEEIAEVRGLGTMVGVQFESRTVLGSFIDEALRNGVLTVYAGAGKDVLRHLVPLVITDRQLEDTLGVFEAALAKIR
jgi:4-aminobutyrate aminotransferase/(S)-3-amino-2-methylpropionate transaminase